jgi:exopolysaccharide biosynthesis polyprenyl glycosylphosphotransferase
MGRDRDKSVTSLNRIKMLGDVVLFNLSITASFWLRFVGRIPKANFASYLDIIPYSSLVAIVVFNFYGLYDTTRKPWSEIVASLIASVLVLTPLTVTISFVLRSFAFPRSVFFLSAFVQFPLLYIWRRLVFRLERKLFSSMKAMVVAPALEALELAEKAGASGYEVVALASDISIDNCHLNAMTGTYSKVKYLQDTCRPSVIFMSGEAPEGIKQSLARDAFESGIELYISPSLYEIMLANSRLDQVDDTPILEVRVGSEPGKEQIKRLMDICFATVGLVMTAPIMLLTAIAIKLDSPGPVFYRQERISQGGKRFMVWKFRTMADGAERNTGPVLSHDNDPRVTRVGRILRAMRIDELPQLWNVLKGDMSIVGPRPERPFFVEQFEKEIPEYSTRHTVKAGITGLAQVAGKYSTSPEDKLKYDLLYAKSASPLTDLRIILQTLKVILMRDKAS